MGFTVVVTPFQTLQINCYYAFDNSATTTNTKLTHTKPLPYQGFYNYPNAIFTII